MQLVQHIDQAERSAVVFQMRRDRIGLLATGFQPGAKQCERLPQRLFVAGGLLRQQRLYRFILRGQMLERGFDLARQWAAVVHTRAQIGREAGGADLADGIGQRIEQGGAPELRAGGFFGFDLARGQQFAQAYEGLGIERFEPDGVVRLRKKQGEQHGEIARFGRFGQPFVAQPFAEFAEKRRPLAEAEIGQQQGGIGVAQQAVDHGGDFGAALGQVVEHVQQGLQSADFGERRSVFAVLRSESGREVQTLSQEIGVGAASQPVQQFDDPERLLHGLRLCAGRVEQRMHLRRRARRRLARPSLGKKHQCRLRG